MPVRIQDTELQPVGPLAELEMNRMLMRNLRERIDAAHAAADDRAREAYAMGLKHGRVAALGWLLVGAVSGFISALAVGFVVFC